MSHVLANASRRAAIEPAATPPEPPGRGGNSLGQGGHATSNGLTTVVENFKGETVAGHVTLSKGERSALAELASNVWQKEPWPQASPHEHGTSIEPAKQWVEESQRSGLRQEQKSFTTLGEQNPPVPQSPSTAQLLPAMQLLAALSVSEARHSQGVLAGQAERSGDQRRQH